MKLSAVVLAAGRGYRMGSDRPKPLHELCGRSMLLHVLDALVSVQLDQIVVVVGYGAEEVTKHVTEEAFAMPIDFIEQSSLRGTGNATAVGLTVLDDDRDDEDVLVLSGNTPLIQGETLRLMADHHRASGAAATVASGLSGDHDRVLPGGGGVYLFRRSLLSPALRRVAANRVGGESRLGDSISVLTSAGHPTGTYSVDNAVEIQGVNNQYELARAEAEMRQRINHQWMLAGVRIVDPQNAYIDAAVELSPEVIIHPGTVLRGRTVVGQGAAIGPHACLTDCVVGARATVEAVSAIDVEIGAGAHVGPYVSLEQGIQIPSVPSERV